MFSTTGRLRPAEQRSCFVASTISDDRERRFHDGELIATALIPTAPDDLTEAAVTIRSARATGSEKGRRRSPWMPFSTLRACRR